MTRFPAGVYHPPIGSVLKEPLGLTLDGDLLARDFEAAGFGRAAHGDFEFELSADLFAAPNTDFGVGDYFEPLLRYLSAADPAVLRSPLPPVQNPRPKQVS